MGGLGSGNRWRSKATTTNEYRRVDIRYMRKQNLLRETRIGTLSWNCHGEPNGSITYHCYVDRLELVYRMQCDGEWQEMRQKVFFDSTRCHYGSERKWFKCPHCKRRCEILYFGRSGFYCRTCYRIPYGSQCEGKLDRMIRKRDKLKARIFDEDRHRRRRGMHRSTFQPLCERYCQLEEQIDSAIIARWGQWY